MAKRDINRDKIINIRVSKGEEQLIKINAGYMGLPVSKYIRDVAICPNIVKYDHSAIERHFRIVAAHTKEIGEVRNSINNMIFTIEASNNYLPREIDYIVELMNRIFETENKLLETLRKIRADEYKMNSRTVIPENSEK